MAVYGNGIAGEDDIGSCLHEVIWLENRNLVLTSAKRVSRQTADQIWTILPLFHPLKYGLANSFHSNVNCIIPVIIIIEFYVRSCVNGLYFGSSNRVSHLSLDDIRSFKTKIMPAKYLISSGQWELIALGFLCEVQLIICN